MVIFKYNATGVETPMDEALAKKLLALKIGSIVNKEKPVAKTAKRKPKSKK